MPFEGKIFEKVFLKSKIVWKNVEKALQIIVEYLETDVLNDSELFDEVQFINNCVSDNIFETWDNDNVAFDLCWIHIFEV